MVAVWNALPGTSAISKFKDRKTAAQRLWTAFTQLPVEPEPVAAPADPTANSKQSRVIGLLQQPQGATVDEIAAVMGWQRHTVRGLISGAQKREARSPGHLGEGRTRPALPHRGGTARVVSAGEDLSAALARLERARRHHLTELWAGYFGTPLPPRTSRSLMIRAVAYKRQEHALGNRLECFLGATPLMTLRRGRSHPNGKHRHVVNYRHVIHALRRKPMALLNLVYREQLFPRRAYQCAFEAILAADSEKQACRIMVELLALAHDRVCEAELAAAIDAELDAGRLPDHDVLGRRFAPDPARIPDITIKLAPLHLYDELGTVRLGHAG